MAEQLTINIFYPLQNGRIVLRTSRDWNANIEPTHIGNDGTRYEFQITSERPYFYFKPCIVETNAFYWSKGANYLALMNAPDGKKDIYPHFFQDLRGFLSGVFEFDSSFAGGAHSIRVYHPPGYRENFLKRYPVLYMHDGGNLFSSDEAFMHREWQIDETMELLDSMNLIDKVIVVGVYPRDRMYEYTNPGYYGYGRFLAEELKTAIDANWRTLPQRERTAVMGSSLGGVVSLHIGWQWSNIFGKAACMSSTFTYRDDLMQRISGETKKDIEIYLDSAWQIDNYEVTRSMRNLLLRRGYQFGKDLLYFAFPEAAHNETYWAVRSHIPFQFFFGKTPDIPANE
jgi:predicted alpha/beta superfamily hydrolase